MQSRLDTTNYGILWERAMTRLGQRKRNHRVGLFQGALEEVEVSNVARTADWMQLNTSTKFAVNLLALSQEVSAGITLNPVASSLSPDKASSYRF